LHALGIRREDFEGAFDNERVATPKEHFHVALLFIDNRHERSLEKKRAKDTPEERRLRITLLGRRLYMFPSSKEGWLWVFTS
jgi:hypothetical protein